MSFSEQCAQAERSSKRMRANDTQEGGAIVPSREQEKALREELEKLWPFVDCFTCDGYDYLIAAKDSICSLDRMVQILLECPKLARESLLIYRNKPTKAIRCPDIAKLPLQIIAESPGATLDHVQQVYKLYPDAIKDSCVGRLPIIITAIVANAHPEIIEYMIRAYPRALFMKFSGADSCSLSVQRPPEKLFFLVSKAVSILLPGIRELHCSVPRDMLAQLLEILPQGDVSKLESFSFHRATDGHSGVSQREETALENLLARCSKLSHLGVQGEFLDISFGVAAIRAIISTNLCLHSLQLSLLYIHSRLLSELFASECCPCSIHLEGVSIQGGWYNDNNRSAGTCNLECLIVEGELNNQFVSGLFRFIESRCLRIRILRFGAYTVDDLGIRESVEKILNRGTIEELQLSYNRAHLPLLTGVLKHDTTMKNLSLAVMESEELPLQVKELLEVLERDNTTLEQLKFPTYDFSFDFWNKAEYILCLNEYGRGRARDPNTEVSDFVAMLDAITTSEPLRRCNRLRTQEFAISSRDQRHPILYGMLRENPSLWTTSQG